MSSRFIFDPVEALSALADAGVDFVVVGGVAQGSHGSAYPTYDLDIVVSGDRENRRRLRVAFSQLGVVGTDVNRGGFFETAAGAVDVVVFPPRSSEYRRLKDDALHASVAGRELQIASIDHLIAMRERRARPYDPLLSLELRALWDEQRQ